VSAAPAGGEGSPAAPADPFGHGSCLIEFNEAGYDAIAED
jgi:hypothetical protein